MRKIILIEITLIILFITGCSNIRQYNSINNYNVKSQSEIDFIETDQPFGSFENPVRCDGPSGERRYLNRLRDSEGNPFSFRRIGSFGIGPYEHILDKYLIESHGNKKEYEVFMDLYYIGYIETKAVFDLKLLVDYYSHITNVLNDSIDISDLRFAWEATEDFDPQHNDDDIDEIYRLLKKGKFKKAQKIIRKLLQKYPLSPDVIYSDLLCKSELGEPVEKELQKVDQLRLSILNGNDGTQKESAIKVISFAEINFILFAINNFEVLKEELISDTDYFLKFRVKDYDDMTEKDIYFNAKYPLRARNVPLDKKVRPAFTLKIPNKNGNDFEKIINEQPYIWTNELKLYPGDKLLIQFNIKDSNLKSYRVVDSIIDPKNTVEIEFNLREHGDKQITELVIQNPFNKQLMYKAEILSLNSKEYQPTSILPVYPGIRSNESWSFPVVSILLSEFKLE